MGVIQRAPGTNRWALRFVDPLEERDYGEWHIDQARFFSRLGLVISIGLWISVLVGMSIVIDHAFARGVPWGAGTLAVIGLALGLSYVTSLRMRVPAMTAVANCIAGLAVIEVAHAALSPTVPDMSLAGIALMITVFFGFVVFRFHPATAAVAVGVYVVVYEVVITVVFRDGHILPTRYWATSILLLNAYAAGLFICLLIERQMRRTFSDERLIEHQAALIDEQRREAEELLLNILPGQIVARLKRSPGVIADRFDDVTVLFADVVGFTPMSARIAPEDLVSMLNEIFTRFDELARAHGVEKIKTIGDAYMAVAGVPEPRADHALAVADLALAMRASVESFDGDGPPVRFRIGLCSGPAVAGVIGVHKFAYDLWGDTVNTAARMESHGVPGEIQLSRSTHEHLRHTHHTTARGTIDIKGKGATETWLLGDRFDTLVPPMDGRDHTSISSDVTQDGCTRCLAQRPSSDTAIATVAR